MVINNLNKINNFEWNSETVIALRAHIGNSQTKLAKELGVRQQTISEWENGLYKPRGASKTLLNLLGRTAGFPFQNFPKKRTQLSFDRFGFELKDLKKDKTILYFHGNAGDLSNRIYKLNELNKERQNIERKVLDQSLEKIENYMKENGLNDYPSSIFVSNDNWHLGVLGIVASRLKEKFHRPSFVISSKDDISTASARSLPGIDIGKIIIEGVNEGILLSGGGHAMAGGFSLEKDKIEEFNMFCDSKILELDRDILPKRTQKYDYILDNIEIDRNFYEFINRASPYGQGNPEPKFIVPNAEIEFCKTVGKGHLKLKISGNNYKNLDCIAFNVIGTPLGDLITHHSGSLIHFIGVIRKNDWQDFKGIQLQIFDAFIA